MKISPDERYFSFNKFHYEVSLPSTTYADSECIVTTLNKSKANTEAFYQQKIITYGLAILSGIQKLLKSNCFADFGSRCVK